MSANAPVIQSTKNVVLPIKEELLKAMQNAEKSPELARYLQSRVQEIIQQSRFYNKSPEAMKAAREVEKAVNDFVQFVEYKFAQKANIWGGVLPETSSFKKMQEGIAEKAASDLTEKNYATIRFDFAISQDGHYVRGYATEGCDLHLMSEFPQSPAQYKNSYIFTNDTKELYYIKSDGKFEKVEIDDFNLFEAKLNAIRNNDDTKLHLRREQILDIITSNGGHTPPLEESTVDSLDQLFNAWLAKKHQIATENGYLFHTDAGGNKIQKLTVKEVEQLLADSAKEFRDYVQESKVSTELVSRQREYPGESRLEAARKEAAQKAVDRIIAKEEAAVEKVEAPEGPETREEPEGPEASGMKV